MFVTARPSPGIEPFWLETYARVAETGAPAHVERLVRALGRWYEVRAYRVGTLRRPVHGRDRAQTAEAENGFDQRPRPRGLRHDVLHPRRCTERLLFGFGTTAAIGAVGLLVSGLLWRQRQHFRIPPVDRLAFAAPLLATVAAGAVLAMVVDTSTLSSPARVLIFLVAVGVLCWQIVECPLLLVPRLQWVALCLSKVRPLEKAFAGGGTAPRRCSRGPRRLGGDDARLESLAPRLSRRSDGRLILPRLRPAIPRTGAPAEPRAGYGQPQQPQGRGRTRGKRRLG